METVESGNSDATELLLAWSRGDLEARDQLMPIMNDELRRIARLRLLGEPAGHTLQPTAVVNELYLKLVQQRRVDWTSRTHFLGTAANMIRKILIDYARVKRAEKRNGGSPPLDLDEAREIPASIPDKNLLDLDQALTRLAVLDLRAQQVVELRFFGGLTFAEIAEVLGVGERTAKRDWQAAKRWLHKEIAGQQSTEP